MKVMLIRQLAYFLLVIHILDKVNLVVSRNFNNFNALDNFNEAKEFGYHLNIREKMDKKLDGKYNEILIKFKEKKLINEILEEILEPQSYKHHKDNKSPENLDKASFDKNHNDLYLANKLESENHFSKILINTSSGEQDLPLKLTNPFQENLRINYEGAVEKNDFIFNHENQTNDFLFYSILIGCLIAGLIVIAATGFCLYAMHKSNMMGNVTEFPQTYGNSMQQSKIIIKNGDKGLAHSAQMYHYQHQKQQMIAMEKADNDLKENHSDNSEDETDEGDYTVYECPGLAPTGEMEVKNPLFNEEVGMKLPRGTDEKNLNLTLLGTNLNEY